MALLERLRAPKKPAAPKKKTAQPKEVRAEKAAVSTSHGSTLAERLLRTPHVSEKAARLADRGTYVFDVPVSAEKTAIKQAVERTYNVKVTAVRTIRGPGKPVMRGRRPGQRPAWKKALVTLAKGQTLSIYEGV
jgi:large subunit ribosomal protein L23